MLNVLPSSLLMPASVLRSMYAIAGLAFLSLLFCISLRPDNSLVFAQGAGTSSLPDLGSCCPTYGNVCTPDVASATCLSGFFFVGYVDTSFFQRLIGQQRCNVGCGVAPSNSSAICGNLKKESPEQCDDGNLRSGDGCDGACRIERGWTCTSPSTGGSSSGGNASGGNTSGGSSSDAFQQCNRNNICDIAEVGTSCPECSNIQCNTGYYPYPSGGASGCLVADPACSVPLQTGATYTVQNCSFTCMRCPTASSAGGTASSAASTSAYTGWQSDECTQAKGPGWFCTENLTDELNALGNPNATFVRDLCASVGFPNGTIVTQTGAGCPNGIDRCLQCASGAASSAVSSDAMSVTSSRAGSVASVALSSRAASSIGIPATCGNGTCNQPQENGLNCSADCNGQCNRDDVCQANETGTGCIDCLCAAGTTLLPDGGGGACQDVNLFCPMGTVNGATFNDGTCNFVCQTCRGGSACGNRSCDNGETAGSCSFDCGVTGVCGDGTCGAGEWNVICPQDC